jgi:hypothetical protein
MTIGCRRVNQHLEAVVGNIGICGLYRAEGWRCKAHPVFQAATWDVVEARNARRCVAYVGAQMARSVRVQLNPLRVGSTAYGGSAVFIAI